VEKQNQEVKLSCKWLEDLTGVNEDMIQQCDIAFDKAKMQVKMSEMREKKLKAVAQVKEGEQKMKGTVSKLKITLKADQLRLSQVLELKRLFRASSGSTPLEIVLSVQGVKKAVLAIDSKWGVQLNPQLEAEIRKMVAFEQLEMLN
jgi:DNA polymerase-3 subunit alpha